MNLQKGHLEKIPVRESAAFFVAGDGTVELGLDPERFEDFPTVQRAHGRSFLVKPGEKRVEMVSYQDGALKTEFQEAKKNI